MKEFFGLRFGRFSARVQMMFGSFCICSVYMVFAQAGHVLCGSKDCAPWLVLCGSKDCFFLFSVDSKGDVKEFFGLRFRRFSARV